MKWIELIKYPQLIPNMDPRVKDLFDIMEELIPIEENRDRLGTFLHWREKCLKAGIINSNDIHLINHEMIHGCGGL
jgi:hypothetical protein